MTRDPPEDEAAKLMAPVCSPIDILDLNLPPRHLLRRPAADEASDHDGDVDAFSTDEFRMYEFKVRRCNRGRSHDWTDCPFAHPGEKARRRDPRRFHYSGDVCPDFRRGGACPRGDACEFAHGVFECWLHPARYRTMPCKDGRQCRRKVCFFAHMPAQLRVRPVQHHHPAKPAVATSPNSTLVGLSLFSPPMSPPISPSVPCYAGKESGTMKTMSYEKLYDELLNALEGIKLSPAAVGSGGKVSALEDKDGSGSSGPDLEWVEELVM